jgi:hypothetical protein
MTSVFKTMLCSTRAPKTGPAGRAPLHAITHSRAAPSVLLLYSSIGVASSEAASILCWLQIGASITHGQELESYRQHRQTWRRPPGVKEQAEEQLQSGDPRAPRAWYPRRVHGAGGPPAAAATADGKPWASQFRVFMQIFGSQLLIAIQFRGYGGDWLAVSDCPDLHPIYDDTLLVCLVSHLV